MPGKTSNLPMTRPSTCPMGGEMLFAPNSLPWTDHVHAEFGSFMGVFWLHQVALVRSNLGSSPRATGASKNQCGRSTTLVSSSETLGWIPHKICS
jgi:hypothetical protein